MQIILFDLMDTLIEDPYHRAFKRFFENKETLTLLRKWKNQDLFLEFEKGEVSEDTYLKGFYKEGTPADVLEKFPRTEKLKKELYKFIKVFDGVPEMLSGLKAKTDVRLAIASNYSIWYHEIFKLQPELETYFDYLFFSCEMGVRKPTPTYFEIILNALQKNFPDLKPQNIFFTDDKANNTQAAADSGMHVHTTIPGNIEELNTAINKFLT